MAKARNTKPAVDPIFAVIEAHRRALIARDLALDAFGKAEQEIPSKLQKSYFLSRVCCGEEHDHIVDKDAPEWLEVSRAWIEAMDAEFLAAIELTNIKPATIAGVAAVTAYYTQMMALDPLLAGRTHRRGCRRYRAAVIRDLPDPQLGRGARAHQWYRSRQAGGIALALNPGSNRST